MERVGQFGKEWNRKIENEGCDEEIIRKLKDIHLQE